MPLDIDWIFKDEDGSVREKTIKEPSVPFVGNGKHDNGKGYKVTDKIVGRISSPNPLVIAKEV